MMLNGVCWIEGAKWVLKDHLYLAAVIQYLFARFKF
ncbi:hypothetical protein VV1062A_01666 [Vibrio vulnificus]|nr:hypothetical protein VV1062A_01666 [Vibrio vulnificus]